MQDVTPPTELHEKTIDVERVAPVSPVTYISLKQLLIYSLQRPTGTKLFKMSFSTYAEVTHDRGNSPFSLAWASYGAIWQPLRYTALVPCSQLAKAYPNQSM